MLLLAGWVWAELLASRTEPAEQTRELACQSAGAGYIIRERRSEDAETADPGCPEVAKYLIGRPLDLNRATAADLALLPGIGPKSAARIVEVRNANHGFKSLAQARQTVELSRPALESLDRWAYVRE